MFLNLSNIKNNGSKGKFITIIIVFTMLTICILSYIPRAHMLKDFFFDEAENLDIYNKSQLFNYSLYYNMKYNLSIQRGFYRDIYNIPKQNQSHIRYILYWDTFFGNSAMSFGLGSEIFKSCPVNNCVATNNRSYLPVQNFDAIIFHGARWQSSEYGVPKKRKNKQKYIFFSLESPKNSQYDINYLINFYNWTMTYRRDSDIHIPYSLIEHSINNYTSPKVQDILKRPKKIAWIVSNCHSKRRKQYVKALQNYIPIDIYGACGEYACPPGESCYKKIENEYKFYLSFENTLCGDYVTEKMFRTLSYNIIPIVYGNSDYSSIAPPYSVIDTKEFNSPRELADYLIYLDRNPKEYLKYFKWKKNYIVKKSKTYALCQLCYLLHNSINASIYHNIRSWFYSYDCII